MVRMQRHVRGPGRSDTYRLRTIASGANSRLWCKSRLLGDCWHMGLRDAATSCRISTLFGANIYDLDFSVPLPARGSLFPRRLDLTEEIGEPIPQTEEGTN